MAFYGEKSGVLLVDEFIGLESIEPALLVIVVVIVMGKIKKC